ncbi:MAG: hypothetical protein ABFS18_05380 [Thermodesulfobacteriota bacterium]
MEQFLFPILITTAGAIFLIRNITHLLNEEKLRNYVENSPKAKLWVKKFGVEKTIILSRKIFLPLGILIACGLIGVGAWSIINLL